MDVAEDEEEKKKKKAFAGGLRHVISETGDTGCACGFFHGPITGEQLP